MYKPPSILSGSLNWFLTEFLSGSIDIDYPSPRNRWTWGLGDLDNIVGPIQPGSLTLITGHPGAGKSVFLRQIAVANAIDADCAIGFYSLESLSGVDYIHIAGGATGARVGELLGVGFGNDFPADVHFQDEVRLRGKIDINRHDPRSGHPCDIMLVDGADFMAGPLEDSLKQLRLLARDTGTPIVVTLGEDLMSGSLGGSERPRGVRRGFSSWERYADLILELVRPDALDRDDQYAGEVDLWLVRSSVHPTPVRITTLAHQFHYGRIVPMITQTVEGVHRPHWRDRLGAGRLIERKIVTPPSLRSEPLRERVRLALADVIAEDRERAIARLTGETAARDKDVSITILACSDPMDNYDEESWTAGDTVVHVIALFTIEREGEKHEVVKEGQVREIFPGAYNRWGLDVTELIDGKT